MSIKFDRSAIATGSAKAVLGTYTRNVPIRDSDTHLSVQSRPDYKIRSIGVNPRTGKAYHDVCFESRIQGPTGKWTPVFQLESSAGIRFAIVRGPGARTLGDKEDRSTVWERASSVLMNRADFRNTFKSASMRRIAAIQYCKHLERHALRSNIEALRHEDPTSWPHMKVRSKIGGHICAGKVPVPG